MKKNRTILFNVMFPVWFFFLYPTALWLLILPVNFAVDSLVLYLSARKQGVEERLQLWKKSIVPIWLFGFLSDILGAAVSFGIMLVTDWAFPQYNTVLFPGSLVVALPGVVVAGALIYVMNRCFSFRKCLLSPQQIHLCSLWLATFTAPYTMLIPLYG